MNLDHTIARIVARRPGAILVAVIALAIASLVVLFTCVRLDSDVLNLLPRSFDSVRTFKTYDQEFAQARELTFALLDENHTTDLDAFTEQFGEMLRREPWVVRVMDRSPMETPHGIEEVQRIALPLLLNLPPRVFDQAIQLIEPQKIQARLHKMRAEIEASSPRAEMELNFDPLGLVAQALKPMAGSFSIEQTRPLSSPDGTLRIVLVVTNQQGLDAYACQAMMRQVEDFKRRVVASSQGKAPQILVTGRTAYVGELSLSMRGDIVSTILGSVVLVAAVFYFGFRRVRPLLAIMHVLLICCLVSVALGGLIFRELNMITIGLCSILVGLGVDFGMLLYGCYQAERNAGLDHEAAVAGALRQLRRGILFGASTTAAAFLSLILSDCRGFAQLGVLIAIGILFAALCMMTAFFVFIGEKHSPSAHDFLFDLTHRFVARMRRKPLPFLAAAGIALAILNLIAIAPVGRLHIEANPKSLEPKDSKAGFALRTIIAKMPAARTEPVLVVVDAEDAQQFHDRWGKLSEKWTALVQQGAIKSFTSPAAFTLSPRNLQANAARLRQIDLTNARTTFAHVLEQEGFSAESFQSAFALLDGLQNIGHGAEPVMDWSKLLPPDSSWWFVLERVLASRPNIGAAYIAPLKTLGNNREKEQLLAKITVAEVPMHVSGWSYTLAELVPWSGHKLIELSVVMLVFNVILLLFLYREAWSLFILMFSLLLSMGAMVACLKIFHISLNLFNALAFPLVLGVGVDYGIYLLLGVRHDGGRQTGLTTIVKPVLLSGLCTVAGFGSLGFSHNPSLSGLGIVCAVGVAWCLFTTIFFILPAYVWSSRR